MKNIDFRSVKINDGFWKAKQDMCRSTTVKSVFDRFTEERATDIVFLDEKLMEAKKVSVSGKYICSDRNESNTAVYCSGTAFVFNNLGENTASLASEQDAVMIKLLKENLFAVTRDQLCKIEK